MVINPRAQWAVDYDRSLSEEEFMWGMSQRKEVDKLRVSSEKRSRKLFNEWMDEGKKPVDLKLRVSQEMIERAREYPIENLVEVNRGGMAKCIWHDDTKPSMSTKRNFAWCFVCSKGGDAISMYRQIHGVDFQTAVLALQ